MTLVAELPIEQTSNSLVLEFAQGERRLQMDYEDFQKM